MSVFKLKQVAQKNDYYMDLGMSAQKIGLPSIEFVIGKSLKNVLRKFELKEYFQKVKQIEFQAQNEQKFEKEICLKEVHEKN